MEPIDPDLARMVDISEQLVTAIRDAVPGWIVAAVTARLDGVDAAAGRIALERAVAVGPGAAETLAAQIAALLALPIDQQPTTPLALMRTVAVHPTELLVEAGARPVARDPFEQRANPDDVFGVAPATWGDLGDEVLAAGMQWGAAKAYLHRKAHRSASE